MSDPNEVQRRYQQFLDLLPLTIALAGLPHSEPGKYYGEDQIESRLYTIRHAYKAARTITKEFVQK